MSQYYIEQRSFPRIAAKFPVIISISGKNNSSQITYSGQAKTWAKQKLGQQLKRRKFHSLRLLTKQNYLAFDIEIGKGEKLDETRY
ncbi:MAG: hypothetical protein JW844_05990 [Candidatus Omnitrophica bacterium]|nr:hypothetical protein [Candidatus Omnitrophota bacterium]